MSSKMNMLPIEDYRTIFLNFLAEKYQDKEPENLYRPISYIMNLGGKRLRPILTLMAADFFGGSRKDALPAAMAVEVFHNFSLVHDDIMDDAPLRRGKPTVHKKWDINTGILSGDAMLIQAYRHLQAYTDSTLEQLFGVFNQTAIEVCEGQQYDIDFETRSDVTIAEYLKMIEYKTSVLIAAALKMGAIVADADKKNQSLIYEFGRNLGIAFQLQDDYLDAFGDPETFGKQVGGDIIENKKTFLYLKTMELAEKNEQKVIFDLFTVKPEDTDAKVDTVKSIFQKSGAVTAIEIEIKSYTEKAFSALGKIDGNAEDKKVFEDFGRNLMQRTV